MARRRPPTPQRPLGAAGERAADRCFADVAADLNPADAAGQHEAHLTLPHLLVALQASQHGVGIEGLLRPGADQRLGRGEGEAILVTTAESLRDAADGAARADGPAAAATATALGDIAAEIDRTVWP